MHKFMIGVILKSKAFLEDLEELEELIATRKKSPSEKLGLKFLVNKNPDV